MKKFIQAAATAAALLVLLPSVAFAHFSVNANLNGQDDNDAAKAGLVAGVKLSDDNRFENRGFGGVEDIDRLIAKANGQEIRFGTVTAISSPSFTINGKDGVVYTVNTTGSTTFNLPFGASFAFANIAVNDKVKVMGTLSGNAISAVSVVDVPANNVRAKARGTVTAVGTNSVTIQTKGGNTVSVATNANTSVVKADGSAGTSSDVVVGSQVSIKGLWNMLTSAFTAIKIKLHL